MLESYEHTLREGSPFYMAEVGTATEMSKTMILATEHRDGHVGMRLDQSILPQGSASIGIECRRWQVRARVRQVALGICSRC